MFTRVIGLRIAVLGLHLFLAPAPNLFAADSPATLTVRDSGTPLYAQQDRETEPIMRLEKGESLTPMAESVGKEVWYMVRTKQGQVGWVRGADITVSTQVKDAFKEKEPASSNWGAVTEDGKAFGGSYTVDPSSSGNTARGFWTLRDANGSTVLRGSWTAQMHRTGWNGTWRATVDGRPGDYRGSWSVESAPSKKAGFAELFEAAVKDAVRGLWTGAGESGGWTIRTFK